MWRRLQLAGELIEKRSKRSTAAAARLLPVTVRDAEQQSEAEGGAVSLTRAQLSMLLEGIDWRRVERTADSLLAI
jgi:hypothetical protein